MKTIKGDLILTEDTTFNESITVEGDIRGDFNLTIKGDIYAFNIRAFNIDAFNIRAFNIDAFNIRALDIDARDIYAFNIYALDIDARDIDALNIICVSRKKKTPKAKTIAYSITLDKFNQVRKEVMP